MNYYTTCNRTRVTVYLRVSVFEPSTDTEPSKTTNYDLLKILYTRKIAFFNPLHSAAPSEETSDFLFVYDTNIIITNGNARFDIIVKQTLSESYNNDVKISEEEKAEAVASQLTLVNNSHKLDFSLPVEIVYKMTEKKKFFLRRLKVSYVSLTLMYYSSKKPAMHFKSKYHMSATCFVDNKILCQVLRFNSMIIPSAVSFCFKRYWFPIRKSFREQTIERKTENNFKS